MLWSMQIKAHMKSVWCQITHFHFSVEIAKKIDVKAKEFRKLQSITLKRNWFLTPSSFWAIEKLNRNLAKYDIHWKDYFTFALYQT